MEFVSANWNERGVLLPHLGACRAQDPLPSNRSHVTFPVGSGRITSGLYRSCSADQACVVEGVRAEQFGRVHEAWTSIAQKVSLGQPLHEILHLFRQSFRVRDPGQLLIRLLVLS